MKLDVTITVSLEEAIVLRDILKSYVQPVSATELSNDRIYLRSLFQKLWEDLRDGLPPVNARLVAPLAFYGRSSL